MDRLFGVCVYLLQCLSHITGFTYKELNVYIFVFIHPIITLILIIWVFRLRNKLKTKKIE